MAAVLDVKGLQVRYGGVPALAEVDIVVEQGAIVSVIGPNGAGKSTLLNAIMGILPANASAKGQIKFEGDEFSGLSVEKRVFGGMSLVPERRELFGAMTVADNLLLGAQRLRHIGAANPMSQLDMIYQMFPRLKERHTQFAATLSGGERQMLAIGRALMAKPRLLMLDEPSLGLAPLIAQETLNLVSRLSETTSILLVEQNAKAALNVSDAGYVLEMGKVTAQGPAASLATDPRIIEAYLGVGKKKANPGN